MTNTENKHICAGNDIWKHGYIKFPATLFKNEKFKKMSSGAKVLYIALLSRLSLSEKNGWRDEDGNVYVYFTISDVTDYIGCCKEKAIKLFTELDEKTGAGLIRRKRNGFGKPAAIYFNDAYNVEYAENPTSLLEESENVTSEKPNTAFSENRICEVGKTDSNYNNINYINKKYINNNYNQSVITPEGADGTDECENKKYYESLLNTSELPASDTKENYETRFIPQPKYDLSLSEIKSNIGYDSLIGKIPMSRLDEFVNIISSILETKDKYIKIGGQMLEASDVKERFSTLDSDHIRYVYESFKNVTSRVHNVRSYIITSLYRSHDSVSLWTDNLP